MILPSVSNDLSFHYNSIAPPFSGPAQLVSGPRGASRSRQGRHTCIIHVFLKERYRDILSSCGLLLVGIVLLIFFKSCSLRSLRSLTPWYLIRAADLSEADAACHHRRL